MEETDLRIDTYGNIRGDRMRITHLPTNISVYGHTETSIFKLKKQLLNELERLTIKEK